jgi:hypothetical protein
MVKHDQDERPHAGLEGGVFKSYCFRENCIQKSTFKRKRLQERANGSKNEHGIPYPRASRGPGGVLAHGKRFECPPPRVVICFRVWI